MKKNIVQNILLAVILNMAFLTCYGVERLAFNRGWKFIQRDVSRGEQVSLDVSCWRDLSIPHDWSIEGNYHPIDNGTDWRGGYLPAGIGWYRKMFTVDSSWKGKKVRILFEGIYANSDVWINGVHLGHRPNGYVSFYYDLTKHLKQGENVIAVRVDTSKPLTGRWYAGSGIYRPVWLLVSEPTAIEPWGVFFTTPEVSKEEARARIQISFEADGINSVRVETELKNMQGKIIAVAGKNISTVTPGVRSIILDTKIQKPQLWAPDTPYVYKLICRLKNGERIIDSCNMLVGIREAIYDSKKGFVLNGIPMKFKGVCDHHTAGAVGSAVPHDVLYRRLKLLKTMGCNAIRTAHNPFAPQFYDICDTLGIMVLNESFDGWKRKKTRDDYGNYFDEWWEKDLTDFIKRDRNHPSVMIWSIGNEVGANPPGTQKKLVDCCHRLDPTRPVTQGGTDPTRGMKVDYDRNFKYLDIVGFNGNGEEVGEYEKFAAMNLGKCGLGTETPHTYQTRGVYRTLTKWRRRDFPAPWESKNIDKWKEFEERVFPIPDLSNEEVFSEETDIQNYQSSYDNASARISARRSWQRACSFPFLMGEFRWGSFDYFGEGKWPQRFGNKGIIDACGFSKDHYYLYQSLWSAVPMVHLLPHWTHPGKEGIEIPVVVYTNCEDVELFLNDKSLGKQQYNGEQLVWRVPYEPGTLKAIAYKEGKNVAEKIVQTAGEPYSFNLKADKKEIRANGTDVVHIEVDIVDEAGVFVPYANNEVAISIKGNIRLLAADNGDPIDHTPYRSFLRRFFRGKMLIILQGNYVAGEAELKVMSPGLRTKNIKICLVK